MLKYTEKEAKKLRNNIHKEIKALRSASVGYPDTIVRETISDIYYWSEKANCLDQALRRAYDLSAYSLFNIEDGNQGYTVGQEDGKHYTFNLTEDQFDFIYDVEAFCASCRRIVRGGGLHPDRAWELHDGSDCARPASRKQQASKRRSDEGFNREMATKEDVNEFKAAQREKAFVEYTEAVRYDRVPQVDIQPEDLPTVYGILDALNTESIADNFTLNGEGTRGGNIVLIKRNGGFYPKAYDQPHVPNTKFEIAAIIYIKKPMVYGEGFMSGTSFIDVTYPIIERYLRNNDQFNRTANNGIKAKVTALNADLGLNASDINF